MFTSRKKLMGVLVNRRVTTILASLVAAVIVILNIYLLFQTFFRGK
jgi:manganese transport protein